jgi:hypothetical protein
VLLGYAGVQSPFTSRFLASVCLTTGFVRLRLRGHLHRTIAWIKGPTATEFIRAGCPSRSHSHVLLH